MKAEDIVSNVEKAAVDFNAAMADMFPNYMVEANVVKIIGAPSLTINFYNVASLDEAPNKILLNTDYMKLMMHLVDGRGKLVDADKFSIELLSWGPNFKPNGIKYRKINGKSPEDAMKKLVKWFDKNKDAIVALKS